MSLLVSMTEQITPFMGFPLTIVAFVVTIGGLGNIGAGVLAGFCLGLVETYGIALTSLGYRSILIYGLFVGVLLVHPMNASRDRSRQAAALNDSAAISPYRLLRTR